MHSFKFYIPTKIIFGPGRINELDQNLPRLYKNILIVTDRRVAEKSGALKKALNQLKKRNVAIFDKIEENPSFETIKKGQNLAVKHQSQLIIGMGGGSPMDAAKGIAIVTPNSLNLNQILQGEPLPNDPLPVVCLPTTSGTGSEVTPFAVFTDTVNKNKCGYSHRKIFPLFSIIDSELTHSMPPPLILNTGLDALTHAIEAYLSTESFPLNDQLALWAINLIVLHLKNALQKDKQAMDKMAFAAMLGGITIANSGTILPHIMGYPLTVFHKIPHGLASAILMPRFLKFLEKKSKSKTKLNTLNRGFKPVKGLDSFLSSLNISTDLSDYGVKKEKISLFVKKTIVKSDIQITPAPVREVDIEEIYDLD